MQANPSLEEANQLIAAGRSAEAMGVLERACDDLDCAVRLRELYLGEQRRDQAMAVSRQLAAGTGVEAHVSRSVIALLQGDPERALRESTLALEADPSRATVHNHLGRALHNMDQSLQAVSALRKAVELHDGYPEAWGNLGLVLRAVGGLDEAIKAYRRAVELAPGFVAAELNLGISLLLADQVDAAVFCLESVLKREPHNLEALLNAGLALQRRGEMHKAGQYFEQAIRLDETHPLGWLYLGVLLHERDEIGPAQEALHQALELNPEEIEAWVELAGIHEQANRLEEAASALARARQIDPAHPAMQLELARLARRQGRLEEALQLLQDLAGKPLPAHLAQRHRFEAGIALDRAGRHEQAFEAYEQGNRLLAKNSRRGDVDPQRFDRECRQLEQWLELDAPGARPQGDDPAADRGADLCFLVGFPCSGTTLLRTMLAAHPGVATIDERPTLERIIGTLRTGKPGYPAALESLPADRLAELRQVYRAEAARHLDGRDAALVVDTRPLRFMHAGLVHRLFPQARILFTLRHPCDVVIGNFMQAYAVNETSIHFTTLQGCVAMYARIMTLWQRIETLLPLNVHYARHEELVADPRAVMAALSTFLGIEPAAATLEMDPPSLAGGWTNYRKQLAPYLDSLRPFLRQFGYSEA